ncbi:MAG: metallophosphoesterase [Deltaproteobacteria bacterium]|nr:metallophosphoesterase [Deltaproteobacteria bacterium]
MAAVADLHCRIDSQGKFRRYLGPAADEADVMCLCGDLCDYGQVEEAEILAEELADIRLPKVAVLGNHDHESDKGAEVMKILTHAGVHFVQGEAWVFDKRVGFAGVKGFGAGFEDATLQAWGEPVTKMFVHESINQALALEMALAKLEASGFKTKIALTHYAPIRATVMGEKPEIFPFLGCSRLAEVIDKMGVVAAFHGHAHRGSLRGQTRGGVPVYNVAMPLLRAQLERRYIVVEVDAPAHGEKAWQPPAAPKPPAPITDVPSPS